MNDIPLEWSNTDYHKAFYLGFSDVDLKKYNALSSEFIQDLLNRVNSSKKYINEISELLYKKITKESSINSLEILEYIKENLVLENEEDINGVSYILGNFIRTISEHEV